MKAASIVFYFFFVSSLLWAQDEMTNKIMGKWKEVGRRCDEKVQWTPLSIQFFPTLRWVMLHDMLYPA